MIVNIVETTSEKAASVKYKKKWLSLRNNRSIDDQSVWMFIDGSNTGWHSAVILNPFDRTVRRVSEFREPASANIGPELWSLLIGLRRVPTDRPLVVVHDYIGTGAWLTGAWEIKSPNVHLAVMEIRKTLIDRPLPSLKFIHHGGHQKDDSDFTRWNNEVDSLCSAKRAIDETVCWE